MWTLPGPLGEGQRDCALPSHAEEGYPLGGGFREPSSGFEVKRVQTGILVMKFRAISGLEPPGHHLGTMGRPGAHRPGLLQIRTCNLSFAWCTPHRLRLGVRKQGARVVIRVVLTTQIEARACQAEQVANSSVWCTPRKWLFSRSNETTRATICAVCATQMAPQQGKAGSAKARLHGVHHIDCVSACQCRALELSFAWCSPRRWSFEPAGPHRLAAIKLSFAWCTPHRSHFGLVA